ncbi:carbohydrate ABC transporter permease [Desulfospira joergensenii]|uniref:carbohydrate ABC transporter permease n=1 Tax=Desulfospira joergensenii TaxID=53329 RepID=UPI00041B05DA|nr:carbohydrate ABC transporter permease [Desulfospira joergensenii]
MNKAYSWFRAGFFYLGLTLVTGLLILPAVVAVSTSFKPTGEIFSSTPSIIPERFTLASYEKLLSIPEFPVYLLNSLIVASVSAAIAVVVGILAAYALVFFQFSGRRLIRQALLTTYMFPAISLVFPIFFWASRLNLLDTYTILILTNLSFVLPIAIWLLLGFFDKIPPELERAARVDGCSRLQAIFHVILPVMLPSIAAVGIFAFILGWGEYLFALTLTLTDAHRTASAGMHALMGNYRIDYGLLTAAGTVIVLPLIILFAGFQKYIVEGLTSASIHK